MIFLPEMCRWPRNNLLDFGYYQGRDLQSGFDLNRSDLHDNFVSRARETIDLILEMIRRTIRIRIKIITFGRVCSL